MLTKFAHWIAARSAFQVDQRKISIDRSDFRVTDNPYEQALLPHLEKLSDEEMAFMLLRYGLTGEDPLGAPQIAERLRRPFLIILDLGVGAELRLRNSPAAVQAMEDVVALEMEDLMDHVRTRLKRPAHIRWKDSHAWTLSRRPVRRLALNTLLEGGIGHLIARAEAAYLEGQKGEGPGETEGQRAKQTIRA